MVAAPPDTAPVTTWSRIAVVSGLLGLVVTQPVLDLFGRNPTFFTAGPYSRGQIVAFGLVVALVPSVLATALLLVVARIDARAGRVAYRACVVLLGGLFGNILLRGLGIDDARLAILATLAGAALAWFAEGTTPGRMLLRYLAFGNVVFLVSFLVLSPTSGLLSGTGVGDLGSISMPRPRGPVVVIVLDEFPVTTLMRGDGSINADRFPGFAALAERTTWFRNASVHHTSTDLAVPALLTGTLTKEGQLPSAQDHPRNLFTLMAGEVPVSAYEPVTTLCPPTACEPPSRPPLSQALRDAAIVYGHRLLPATLRDPLPDIGASWGGFVDDGSSGPLAGQPEGAAPVDRDDPFAKLAQLRGDERSRAGQAAVLAARTNAIDADPMLHFIHVLLPHVPWVLTPEGHQLLNLPTRVEDPEDPGYAWADRQRFQLHSMQVGAADVAIGNLIDHLDELDVWDETTLVVVSDHGVGTSDLPRLEAPEFGRENTPQSTQELHRVPLFIHSPMLTDGAIVDEPAQSIDVLPTLIDLLDIEVGWRLDGHSLVDGSAPHIAPVVGGDVGGALEVARRHAAEFPYGDDWTALAAVGHDGDLVGQTVADLAVGEPSRLRWQLDHGRQIGNLPTDDGAVPRLLTGLVEGGSEEPPELLVVVNGTVAGVTGGYVSAGDAWRFSAFLGPYLVDGANEFAAYEVDTVAGRRVLRPVG